MYQLARGMFARKDDLPAHAFEPSCGSLCDIALRIQSVEWDTSKAQLVDMQNECPNNRQ